MALKATMSSTQETFFREQVCEIAVCLARESTAITVTEVRRRLGGGDRNKIAGYLGEWLNSLSAHGVDEKMRSTPPAMAEMSKILQRLEIVRSDLEVVLQALVRLDRRRQPRSVFRKLQTHMVALAGLAEDARREMPGYQRAWESPGLADAVPPVTGIGWGSVGAEADRLNGEPMKPADES